VDCEHWSGFYKCEVLSITLHFDAAFQLYACCYIYYQGNFFVLITLPKYLFLTAPFKWYINIKGWFVY